MTALVLASGSRFRRKMLEDAGLAIETVPPELDERAVEAPLAGTGATPADVAAVLAEAKAQEVSGRMPGRLVLGCDQTLSLGERIFHKPIDMDAAARHLLALGGNTHQLNTAVALVQDGETVWRHTAIADLTMRALSPAEIGRYLSRAGEGVLSSVGAYQIEGPGIGLFERVDGDFWTIVGLPLLPVLGELRQRGMLDG
ncbi:MAG: Maf-like protein [Mesorhizobium amorphae]|nr:MAG: Maf-like protein [Mesorhizobium amorphae]